MGHRERDALKEFLFEKLKATGEFREISMDYSPLDGGARDPERGRHISCQKERDKFLISVHSNTQYNHGCDAFVSLLRFATHHGYACVSVFDDAFFYRKDIDTGRPRAPQLGDIQTEIERIKLYKLEKTVQEFGSVTYYKNKVGRLEVVSYSKGVIADYSQSQDVVPREYLKQRELLTVMEPRVEQSLEEFTLAPGGGKRGIQLAQFIPAQKKDVRIEHLIEEIEAGNTEITSQITYDDILALKRRGVYL